MDKHLERRLLGQISFLKSMVVQLTEQVMNPPAVLICPGEHPAPGDCEHKNVGQNRGGVFCLDCGFTKKASEILKEEEERKQCPDYMHRDNGCPNCGEACSHDEIDDTDSDDGDEVEDEEAEQNECIVELSNSVDRIENGMTHLHNRVDSMFRYMDEYPIEKLKGDIRELNNRFARLEDPKNANEQLRFANEQLLEGNKELRQRVKDAENYTKLRESELRNSNDELRHSMAAAENAMKLQSQKIEEQNHALQIYEDCIGFISQVIAPVQYASNAPIANHIQNMRKKLSDLHDAMEKKSNVETD